ncbi:MAG TPA: peptidylprolyl isomerase [Gemmatimonadaceae bacterium]|nr:peptidylprolyl isomerase [Gemmatimonadaceae bacterium]
MRMQYSFVILAAAAASLGAQDPTPPVALARDSVVPLDRIVAVVGDQPITQYDVQERMLQLQQQPGFQAPRTQEEFDKLASEVVGQLIDEEVLVQKAIYLKVEVLDTDLSAAVDRQIRDVRGRFASDAEFRAELQKAGLGTPEEYRRFLIDQMRRTELQRRVIEQLRAEGKIPPVNVTQTEVEEAFERSRASLPRRPATVTFRQIVVAPKPSEAARVVAKAKAESLLVEIKGGADFERVARRESADSVSREQGGDLGWNRRGRMVKEFEQWMFALRPGAMSPVIETVHGFHIIRVDRVQPGEVKSRHILVKPVIDSLDIERARREADSVATQWAAGVAFDTLARRHHDYGSGEETTILTPIPTDSGLPPSYKQAFAGKKANDIVNFPITGPNNIPKFVVAQLVTVDAGGEYTLADLRERVRQQLVEEGSIRRFLDNLRKEAYVSIRLGAVTAGPGPER